MLCWPYPVEGFPPRFPFPPISHFPPDVSFCNPHPKGFAATCQNRLCYRVCTSGSMVLAPTFKNSLSQGGVLLAFRRGFFMNHSSDPRSQGSSPKPCFPPVSCPPPHPPIPASPEGVPWRRGGRPHQDAEGHRGGGGQAVRVPQGAGAARGPLPPHAKEGPAAVRVGRRGVRKFFFLVS